MWTCTNCQTTNDGEGCTACGQPREQITKTASVNESPNLDLEEIERKIRQVPLSSDPTIRWAKRGALVGFAVGCLLTVVCGIVAIAMSPKPILGTPRGSSIADVLYAVFALGVFVLPVLCAAAWVFFGTVIRPILVAIFCSIERYEQEYGTVSTQAQKIPRRAVRRNSGRIAAWILFVLIGLLTTGLGVIFLFARIKMK